MARITHPHDLRYRPESRLLNACCFVLPVASLGLHALVWRALPRQPALSDAGIYVGGQYLLLFLCGLLGCKLACEPRQRGAAYWLALGTVLMPIFTLEFFGLIAMLAHVVRHL